MTDSPEPNENLADDPDEDQPDIVTVHSEPQTPVVHQLLPVALGEDHRVQWFRSRLTAIMGVDNDQYADEAIAAQRQRLDAFFNVPIESYADVPKQIVLAWRTFYDRMVEETVTELEEVVPEPLAVAPKTKKKGKGKKTTVVAEEEKPEPVFVEVQRIVQTFVKTPIIHLHFGHMPDEDLEPDMNYFYFIRKATAEIREWETDYLNV